MTRWQKATVFVIAADVVALAIYDCAAAYFGDGKPATISWMLTWIGQQWWGATVVFALGYLFGHFFAQDNAVTLDDKEKK